jgi:rare lipoprotein A
LKPALALLAAFFFTVTAEAKTTGLASYYSCCKRTANGERFNKNGFTAAHRRLPFGTVLRVTNLRNGKSVNVRVNDRGPFIRGRVIDLSLGAARAIGLTRTGVTRVSFVVIKQPRKKN